MNSGLKSGLVLLVLGILCGTLLALVNSFTSPIIADIEEAAQYEALKEFFYDNEDPNYNTFIITQDYDLTKLKIDEAGVEAIFVVKTLGTDNVEALGYLVYASGYSGDAPVLMLIVVESNMIVRGYTVVSHKETTGFGADIVDEDFGVDTLIDLSGFGLPPEIDAVVNATWTVDAIKECFNIVAARASDDFGGGLDD
ncbi:MAG: FMN-binding protein [Tenericutes bacterium]|nr:FMN-binding protein [Mycoplasmatota bacterium]